MRRGEFSGVLVFGGMMLFAAAGLMAQAAAGAHSGQGQQLFSTNCAYCHGADGKGGRGPAIATLPNIIAMSDGELQGIIHNGAGNGAMPAFADLGEDKTVALVQYLRVLQGKGGGGETEQAVTGNTESGRAIFFGKGQCSSCHMVKGEGGFIAPDLTTYGQGHGVAQIKKIILKPDETLATNQRVVEVKMKSGAMMKGVLRTEDNISLVVQTVDGNYHFLTRNTLVEVKFTGHSLMPQDFGTRLTPAEINDVASFLIATGKSVPMEAAPGRRRRGGN